MPAIGYKCQAGLVKFEDCLKECPLGNDNRCAARPLLQQLKDGIRVWNGRASTTQLIKGTREAMLEIQSDYYVSPQSKVFALLGTDVHGKLEECAGEGEIAEMDFKGDISGIADLYDKETKTLWDYKTTSSYKAAKALGMDYSYMDDPNGGVYKTNCKSGKKGDPRVIKKFFQNEDMIDMRDWELQLNNYRINFEKLGYEVKETKVQVIVRDGGSQLALSRGLTENLYVIQIPHLPDSEVVEYFSSKDKALKKALSTEWCDLCNEDETWGGLKCDRFCDVKEQCERIGL